MFSSSGASILLASDDVVDRFAWVGCAVLREDVMHKKGMSGGDLWWLVDMRDDSSIAPCLRMVLLHKKRRENICLIFKNKKERTVNKERKQEKMVER